MTFGTEWGFGTDESTSRKIYETYREAGGNYVDTANNYTNGSSEEILGRLVAPERDSVVVSTKYTFPTDSADPNTGGNHRKSCAAVSRRAFVGSAPTTSICCGSRVGSVHAGGRDPASPRRPGEVG